MDAHESISFARDRSRRVLVDDSFGAISLV